MVRTQKRKKAAAAREPLPAAIRPNQRSSMDFIDDRLVDQRCFRVLMVVDQFTRDAFCCWRISRSRPRRWRRRSTAR